jgi:hypothetical protein
MPQDYRPTLTPTPAATAPIQPAISHVYGADEASILATKSNAGIREWANQPPSVIEGALERAARRMLSFAGVGQPMSGADFMLPALGTLAAVSQGTVKQAAERVIEKIKSRGFYSRVEEAVGKIPARGAHPNKVASILSSNASKEEIQARKIPELLASHGDKPVTPEVLRAHLDANPFGVNVKTLADNPGKVDAVTRMEELEALPSLTGAQAAELQAIHDGTYGNAKPTKFGQYTVPGGEHYRETLITLPVGAVDQATFAKRYRGDFDESASDAVVEKAYQRYLAGDSPISVPRGDTFKSSHFDEPNIVAHTRSNTRTLPTGERGRFIEEVQSDWHQAGKQRGYGPPPTKQVAYYEGPNGERIPVGFGESEAAALEAAGDWRSTPGVTLRTGSELDMANHAQGVALRVKADAYKKMHDYVDLHGPQAYESGPLAWREMVDAYKAASNRFDDATRSLGAARMESESMGRRVPDAPFKDSWPELGLKQQLIEAADDDTAEWIGFTAGETQAARYDLSKHVDELVYYPGTQDLQGFKGGAEVVFHKGIAPERLGDYIGKDAADRLLNNPTVRTPGRGGTENLTLKGVDLSTGGEGMKAFYDNLLPKRLEKIVKPFGGTVERSGVPVPMNQGMQSTAVIGGLDYAGWQQRADELYAVLPDRPDMRPAFQEAAANVRKIREMGSQSPAWIVKLTPEMKAKIRAAGLPLAAVPLAISHEQNKEQK